MSPNSSSFAVDFGGTFADVGAEACFPADLAELIEGIKFDVGFVHVAHVTASASSSVASTSFTERQPGSRKSRTVDR